MIKIVKFPINETISDDFDLDVILNLSLNVDEKGIIKSYDIDENSIDEVSNMVEDACEEIYSEYDEDEDDPELEERITAIQLAVGSSDDLMCLVSNQLEYLIGSKMSYHDLIKVLIEDGIYDRDPNDE